MLTSHDAYECEPMSCTNIRWSRHKKVGTHLRSTEQYTQTARMKNSLKYEIRSLSIWQL